MEGRAEVVVSPLVQVMLDKLASPLLQEFRSEWEVGKELGELSSALQAIQPMVSFAEDMQIMDQRLKFFLGELRDVAYRADNTLDEFIYEAYRQKLEHERTQRRQVHQHFSFSLVDSQILHRHEIAPSINEIKGMIVETEKKLEPHYLIGSVQRKPNQMERRLQNISLIDLRQKSSSLIDDSNIFGRKEDADVVIKILLSDQFNQMEVPVLAIVGMGGLGKTTFAQLVYNNQDVEKHFDMRAWICVSEDFNLERLTKAILESATRKSCDLKDLEPLQRELQHTLRGKRLLLVLDDVWNENIKAWYNLRAPFRVAEKGSRIIVTTRSEIVSSIMSPIRTHYLQGLTDEDCWLLFKKRAFIDEKPDAPPILEAIGKKIVRKCKGLPLAVNTLGGLLQTKLDEKEWQIILENDIWDLEGDDIFPALSLSYHHLPAHLKQCFAYCSLFPKDFEFEKETLVLLWMAEGFVRSKQVGRMEDIGGQYFDELLHRSFFQYSWELKSRIVMHDLMHDLAQSVSREMCFRMEIHKSCDISEKARHLSLIGDLDLINDEFYKCKSLSTFLSLSDLTHGKVPCSLFEELKCLRVLDLSDTRTERLPHSLGNLKHLRYLNLSGTSIRLLPDSLCNLYNLQTLILEYCDALKELPKDMGNLINLQHIMMDKRLWKAHRPVRIGRLTCLKTLPYFIVSQNDGFKIEELKELQYLQGKLCISKLENVNVMEAKEANLRNKQKIDELVFKWSNGTRVLQDGVIKAVIEDLEPHTGLKFLTIKHYGGLTFPNWMMELSGYYKLISVTLSDCIKCKSLPPLGKLPLLKSLEIEGLEKVKLVSHEFYGNEKKGGDKKGFQSLKFLKFIRMEGLEEWFGAEEGEFPCLQELSIKNCRKLKKLPPLSPTVKLLNICACDVLSELPRLPSVRNLRLVNCNEGILSSVSQCTSLSSLHISGFRDLKTFPPTILQPLAETLERFEIEDFSSLTKLSEDVGLQDLASLQHLQISTCPSLTSFPKRLHQLTSLKELTIKDCDQLISFTEEEEEGQPPLPSMLERFKISGCRNLRSLPRGLHNLTSLQEFSIVDCNLVMLFPNEEEGESLPSMLRSLNITKCYQLHSLPRGLRNLSALQALRIYQCNNITSLPKEGLPNSLHSLSIWACPKLMYRCQEGGEDWPKIAHIPNVSLE